jgi:hypothetical protein
MSEANVYQRLQKARVALKKLPITESGNNKFAGYTYMELGDFLPHIVDLCDAHGLCTVISFGEYATLTVVNSDKPAEQIEFASPMSSAELKGCHAIQNLGAVETYLRRYLYIAAFDIVEHDALDSTQGKDKKEEAKPARVPYQKPASVVSDSDNGKTGGALTPDQIKFFPRIKIALDSLYGTDTDMKKTLIKRLTAFTNKDGKEIPGIEDYRKKDGMGLKILCSAIEKQAKAGDGVVEDDIPDFGVPKDDEPF